MKLTDLKAAVYKLAGVKTTKQLKKKLKAQNEASQPLDMRYKASWENALEQLKTGQKNNSLKAKHPDKTAAAPEKEQSSQDFETWEGDPSNEFAALLAEADGALEAFDEKMAQTKKLTRRAIAMTESLDEFAEATLSEAKQLAKQEQKAQKTAKDADLN